MNPSTPHPRIIRILTALTLSIAAASTGAQELADCSGIPGSDVPGLLECLDNHYAILDKDLNQTYKKLMASLPEDQKKSLRDEQRKWLKKKAACKNKDDSPRGYAAQLACEVDETQKRVVYLKSLSK